jgi:hypothetical protein
MKIAIDFDGTVVTHEYPNIGRDIGAVPVLKDMVKAGHELILNTMRSGKQLDAAVLWFAARDIPLYGVNEDPEQKKWTQSPKVFANLYIDDAALGVPLLFPKDPEEIISGARPWVDWEKVRELMGMKQANIPPVAILERV